MGIYPHSATNLECVWVLDFHGQWDVNLRAFLFFFHEVNMFNWS